MLIVGQMKDGWLRSPPEYAHASQLGESWLDWQESTFLPTVFLVQRDFLLLQEDPKRKPSNENDSRLFVRATAMDSQLMAAILGGAATLIAPIVTWKLTTRSHQKRFAAISDARLHRMEDSIWKGHLQFAGSKQTEITITFNIKGKMVNGRGRYDHETYGKTAIVLEGGFVSDYLLKLDYRNADVQRLHFGMMILEMDANSSVFDGGIMAYGRRPDGVYTGSISLTAF